MYILNSQIIHKIFDQYKIKISYHLDIINIQIENNDNIYESFYTLEYLQNYQLLNSNYTIVKMIKFIIELINQKNIIIEKNENNLKLVLISTLSKYPNVKLIINHKNIISNELIEQLINEIKAIKNENNKLNNRIKLIEDKNDKLNKRIEIIEDKNDKLNNRIKLIENNNNGLNKTENKNDELNKRIELIENNNNELKNKIKILEGYHKDKNKIKLTKCNLQNINSIQSHNNQINSLCSFTSGNIISVSADKSIIIYDIHLNILQNIQNAHDKAITYLC